MEKSSIRTNPKYNLFIAQPVVENDETFNFETTLAFGLILGMVICAALVAAGILTYMKRCKKPDLKEEAIDEGSLDNISISNTHHEEWSDETPMNPPILFTHPSPNIRNSLPPLFTQRENVNVVAPLSKIDAERDSKNRPSTSTSTSAVTTTTVDLQSNQENAEELHPVQADANDRQPVQSNTDDRLGIQTDSSDLQPFETYADEMELIHQNADELHSIQTDTNDVQPLQTDADLVLSIQTNADDDEQIQTDTDEEEHIQTDRDEGRHIQNELSIIESDISLSDEAPMQSVMITAPMEQIESTVCEFGNSGKEDMCLFENSYILTGAHAKSEGNGDSVKHGWGNNINKQQMLQNQDCKLEDFVDESQQDEYSRPLSQTGKADVPNILRYTAEAPVSAADDRTRTTAILSNSSPDIPSVEDVLHPDSSSLVNDRTLFPDTYIESMVTDEYSDSFLSDLEEEESDVHTVAKKSSHLDNDPSTFKTMNMTVLRDSNSINFFGKKQQDVHCMETPHKRPLKRDRSTAFVRKMEASRHLTSSYGKRPWETFKTYKPDEKKHPGKKLNELAQKKLAENMNEVKRKRNVRKNAILDAYGLDLQ
ncbi:uncharacterized protein LOC128556698 [Mercenaria mercenaria]|uniref:uncharacterized protein LOC128556698 n=1 Tax=Mercenaria mercenaria TaxID=6596 RepID=UPI00234F24A2|nr:uncharacterized protein LOC128556698 [Mercenaria mercenaria]